MNNYQSGLTFDVTTSDVTTGPPVSSVPEPATVPLMGLGLACVAFVGMRRKLAS